MAGREESQPVIEIRALTQHAEYIEAVRLQKLIWGFDEIELLPVRLFVTATKVGGQVFGAFDGPRMIGFCVAIPGIKPGARGYLHSHMLGVEKEYRDYGVGRMLKLEQRHDAIRRGINLIEWTFDPLETKNAYFNLERLGAIVRRFVLNQYGTTTSRLHGGLPTDRCIAEWWVASPRVEALLSGTAAERPPIAARISVPADIDNTKQTDPSRAREIQKRVSDQFLEYFSQGLAATGFERTTEAGVYLLSPWDSN
jgi:predicted GNAT superfamily acetyltransferase